MTRMNKFSHEPDEKMSGMDTVANEPNEHFVKTSHEASLDMESGYDITLNPTLNLTFTLMLNLTLF